MEREDYCVYIYIIDRGKKSIVKDYKEGKGKVVA